MVAWFFSLKVLQNNTSAISNQTLHPGFDNLFTTLKILISYTSVFRLTLLSTSKISEF